MITFSLAIIVILPLLFLVAVLIKLATIVLTARQKGESEKIPTEPIVLMSVGFAFLVMNVQFVPLVARLIREQLRLDYSGEFPLTQAAFAVATAILIASFAKAAWTHLNLEEGQWGSIDDYRKDIWPHWKLSGVEFWLRVGIAVLVVLLQKQIYDLRLLEDIELARSWSFPVDNEQPQEFLRKYREWLALTALYGLAFFFLITVWLLIAARKNWKREGYIWAIIGTATFSIPGLFICWSLNYLSTGSGIPSHRLVTEPNSEYIISLSVAILVFASVILFSVGISLAALKRIFREFRQALRGSRSSPATEAPN